MDLNQLIFHNPIPVDTSSDSDLLNATLNSVTSVIHSLLALPKSLVNDSLEIMLPDYDPSKYPRSKPLPKAKPLTKWESFAAKKGIKSRKKTLSKYNEQGELKASWGYKAKDAMQDWCIPVPTKYHSETRDMYEIKREEESAKKSKITAKQDKNLEKRSTKIERKYLNSKKSTASLGKFDSKLKNEIKAKRGKRSFSDNISKNPNSEVESSLLIANKL